jgi:hypothetical protein
LRSGRLIKRDFLQYAPDVVLRALDGVKHMQVRPDLRIFAEGARQPKRCDLFCMQPMALTYFLKSRRRSFFVSDIDIAGAEAPALMTSAS